MMSRRDYAVSLGLAEHKRGRMSMEAWDAIKVAESEGKTFSDSSNAYPEPPKGRGASVRRVVTVGPNATERAEAERKRKVQKVVQEPAKNEPRAFTGKFEVAIPGGSRKALSNRTACTCGASLMYCLCATPTVYRTVVDPGADDVDSVLNISRV